MKKICITLGTRPEIIKLSPVIQECQRKKIDFFIIHTRQHYSEEMDKIFFEDLEIKKAKYNLNIRSNFHGDMTGRMMIEIEKILLKEKPDIVLVQGDTNSVLAGALSASKLHIPVGHIEAGLRSYDRKMPEEINRTIVDHISDFLLVPTISAKDNLIKEGIDKRKIYMVGNTVVDAVFFNLNIAKKRNTVLEDLKLSKKTYGVLTMHRPSNTDEKINLKSILDGLKKTQKLGLEKIIFLAHPRVEKKIKEYKIKIPKNVIKIKPVGYFDMLVLLHNAKLVFTDSGGIQEEACILNIPCVTLRDNTERPETVETGGNILVGASTDYIFEATRKMLKIESRWKNPFGNGKSAERIIKVVIKNI